MSKMKIKIFVTGGTIDKVYNELNGELVFKDSCISTMLEKGRSMLDVSIETLLLKDSLEMDVRDREMVVEKCKACEESNIIVTHGTDTMVATAEALGKNINKKTIVLLGAMIPYSMTNSDALFNLGCAVSSVQLLKKGVYIVMNGQVFSWENVIKNQVQGYFQRKSS
ncbi:MAG: asparaginase domain-containing protein [Gammaproteobacteria bacterium]